MSSDPPEEPADSDELADPDSGHPEAVADEAPEPRGEEDRSYEERVLNELVPEVGVGDDEPAAHEPDPEGDIEPEAEAEAELSDALEAIDDDLLNAFVGIVISIKAGILLCSIGLLVIGFLDMVTVGGGLIAVGCLAFARAAKRYWHHKQTQAQADGDDDNGRAETAESGRNG